MTKFESHAAIVVRVEANNRDDARKDMAKLIAQLRAALPTGVTINFPEDGDFPVYRA